MATGPAVTASPSGRLPLKKAAVFGLAGGAVFFFILQPLVIGWRPEPILQREGSLSLVLFSFPLVVLPAVIVAVALFRPKSKMTSFRTALCFSAALLVPIPLLDYWVVAPKDFGESPVSRGILLDLLLALVAQNLLALIASSLAAVLSPPLYRLVARRLRP